MIVAIVRAYCGSPPSVHLRMFGYVVLACFVAVGRFGDLCRLRFNAGFYEVRTTHPHFFSHHSKNDQNYIGYWVGVAASRW